MNTSHNAVLQLDIQGTPQSWITLEQAAVHVATGAVAWSLGDRPLARLRGGQQLATGRQSVIDVPPIIALAGGPRVNLFRRAPCYTRAKLMRRDRLTCAYCGQRFAPQQLSADHILPQSRGGPWQWMNLVTACQPCNRRKADRTPEEAGMPLLYLPYVPSRFEDFLLQGRSIRGDVHAWLAARLPRHSRLN